MELFEKTFNIQTGETVMRAYTPDEIAEVEAEIAATNERLAAKQEADKAREAVLAKLGLTIEEASALLG